jgi:hypothetical protein
VWCVDKRTVLIGNFEGGFIRLSLVRLSRQIESLIHVTEIRIFPLFHVGSNRWRYRMNEKIQIQSIGEDLIGWSAKAGGRRALEIN